MKILVLDIETRPNIAHIWETWNVKYVSPNQLVQEKDILCFAAKWLGHTKTEFYSTYMDGKFSMLGWAWDLLNEADAVVHFNGRTFDMPFLNRGFLQMNYEPPSPYKHIDLLEVVRKQFNFPYNTLDYVCRELGIGHKVKHSGHELWVKCMTGDPEAWAKMERYNKRDVRLTEKLYNRIRPWIIGHPSIGAETGKDRCAQCGSYDFVKEGFSYTATGKYQRYHCRNCHAWLTASKRVSATRIKVAR